MSRPNIQEKLRGGCRISHQLYILVIPIKSKSIRFAGGDLHPLDQPM